MAPFDVTPLDVSDATPTELAVDMVPPPTPAPAQQIEQDDATVPTATTPRTPGSTTLTAAMGLGQQRATVSWKDLCVVAGAGTKAERAVLKPCSGTFKPGELVALVGPSGAGKSTFLNALAGRSPGVQVTGDVRLSGTAMNAEQRRRRSAYVMQEDALVETQTPREILEFAAALRLGIGDADERTELVDACLELLGLLKCADQRVGSSVVVSDKGRVSGGEKKRTAIAQELLSRPAVVFLDEPTTGLDSHSAKHLVIILRELARQGVAVVATVHQPSSETFALFDRVVMLRSGEMVYDGPVHGVTGFFAAGGHQVPPRSNPCDFAMLMLQRLPEAELQAMALERSARTPPPDVASFPEQCQPDEVRAPFGEQLRWLIWRDMCTLLRDPKALRARMISTMILGLLGGMLMYQGGKDWGDSSDPKSVAVALQTHFGLVFFLSMGSLYQNAAPPLLAFIPERPVFVREYASRTYSSVAYANSKFITDTLAVMCTTTLAYTIVHFLGGLQGLYPLQLSYYILLGLVGSSIALCVGAVTASAASGAETLPMLITPQWLFSGFFIAVESLPVWLRWLPHVNPTKHAIGLVLLDEFSEGNVPADLLPAADALLTRSSISRTNAAYAHYLSFLIGMSIVLRVLAVWLLRRKVRTAFE